MHSLQDLLKTIEGFEWDPWNIHKNVEKHEVHPFECEEVFFREPDFGTLPQRAEHKEDRFYVIGRTNAGRTLTVIFTIRKNKIRVISARNASRKERRQRNEKA